jgi:hypothetical protein
MHKGDRLFALLDGSAGFSCLGGAAAVMVKFSADQ